MGAFMFDSPFSDGSPFIPEGCDVIFVSDLFAEDYVGGAELTTKALIDSSPLKIYKLHSRDVSLELLQQGVSKYWIFGNFAQLNLQLIPSIIANMKYSILEYDYKFCQYRSPGKHKIETGAECDCNDQDHGKLISAFFYGAQMLWWMSEKQEELYCNKFPFLREKSTVVLSSVFDDGFFASIKLLNEKYKDHERKGWVVLGSQSWIKGAEDAKNWCEENNHEYEVVWNVPYAEVLEKLAKAEGFVYLPKDNDTCPRMVIEAKLLGCKLHLNEYVQHAKEIWFDTDDELDTLSYLYAARERFWAGIANSMEYSPPISGYTTTRDCNKHRYPWRQSIQSMLGFCDEVVVVDGGSTDGTWEELQEWQSSEPRLIVHQHVRDWTDKRFAVYDGAQKAVARSICSKEFCWQQDADEVVHENDYIKIRQLVRNFPRQIDLVCLPMIEYWGSTDKVRMDIFPWKWRLSRNKENITHGIPAHLRRFDEEDNLYAGEGTDGCDYVDSETFEWIPSANFYTTEIDKYRLEAMAGNKEVHEQYQEWFQRNIELLPSVHHYSWIDIERKIKTYRDYWSQHWQSLYDIIQEDTPENNMFFQRPWSEVTDEDITSMANDLTEKLGGWIFHSPVDFDVATPHLELDLTQPMVMNNAE